MKSWQYTVQIGPKDVINKLESALSDSKGFIFNMNNKASSFSLKKPVKYPDQILHRNRIIVNGKVSDSPDKNGAKLELTFSQGFYLKMTILSMIVFGMVLFMLLSQVTSGVFMYLSTIALVAVAVILWFTFRSKIERDTRKYKTLIKDILNSD